MAQALELLPLVRAKDLDAGRKLAEGHLRYAAAICRRYVGEEYYDVAYEAVWDAILGIMAGGLKHDNVTGYIVSFVRGALREQHRQSHILSIPRKTNEDRKDKGLEPYKQRKRTELAEVPTVPDTSGEDLLTEILLKVVESDVEKQIVLLRVAGHSDVDIAGLIGRSESWVWSTRKILLQRYIQYGHAKNGSR